MADMVTNAKVGTGECADNGDRAGSGEKRGGQAAEAKRLERAARKLAQAAEDSKEEDGLSMWELKYFFQDPVGEIRIAEDWSGEGNGIAGLQWLGGVVLSRYMDSRQVFPEKHFEGCRVIEVGAGCGLTSIYAALRGADVTITDMDIDKCVENVESNLGPRGLTGNVLVQRLEWASAEDLALLEPPYDVVIAGDCLYEEACIAPLLQTMWALAGPKTEILLCGVVGHGILESFLAQVDSYFHRETVDTSKIDTLAKVSDEDAHDATAEGAPPTHTEVCLERENAPRCSSVQRNDTVVAGDGSRRERPGQRALLRLRKKQQAAGQEGAEEESLREGAAIEPVVA